MSQYTTLHILAKYKAMTLEQDYAPWEAKWLADGKEPGKCMYAWFKKPLADAEDQGRDEDVPEWKRLREELKRRANRGESFDVIKAWLVDALWDMTKKHSTLLDMDDTMRKLGSAQRELKAAEGVVGELTEEKRRLEVALSRAVEDCRATVAVYESHKRALETYMEEHLKRAKQ